MNSCMLPLLPTLCSPSAIPVSSNRTKRAGSPSASAALTESTGELDAKLAWISEDRTCGIQLHAWSDHVADGRFQSCAFDALASTFWGIIDRNPTVSGVERTWCGCIDPACTGCVDPHFVRRSDVQEWYHRFCAERAFGDGKVRVGDSRDVISRVLPQMPVRPAQPKPTYIDDVIFFFDCVTTAVVTDSRNNIYVCNKWSHIIDVTTHLLDPGLRNDSASTRPSAPPVAAPHPFAGWDDPSDRKASKPVSSPGTAAAEELALSIGEAAQRAFASRPWKPLSSGASAPKLGDRLNSHISGVHLRNSDGSNLPLMWFGLQSVDGSAFRTIRTDTLFSSFSVGSVAYRVTGFIFRSGAAGHYTSAFLAGNPVVWHYYDSNTELKGRTMTLSEEEVLWNVSVRQVILVLVELCQTSISARASDTAASYLVARFLKSPSVPPRPAGSNADSIITDADALQIAGIFCGNARGDERGAPEQTKARELLAPRLRVPGLIDWTILSGTSRFKQYYGGGAAAGSRTFEVLVSDMGYAFDVAFIASRVLFALPFNRFSPVLEAKENRELRAAYYSVLGAAPYLDSLSRAKRAAIWDDLFPALSQPPRETYLLERALSHLAQQVDYIARTTKRQDGKLSETDILPIRLDICICQRYCPFRYTSILPRRSLIFAHTDFVGKGSMAKPVQSMGHYCMCQGVDIGPIVNPDDRVICRPLMAVPDLNLTGVPVPMPMIVDRDERPPSPSPSNNKKRSRKDLMKSSAPPAAFSEVFINIVSGKVPELKSLLLEGSRSLYSIERLMTWAYSPFGNPKLKPDSLESFLVSETHGPESSHWKPVVRLAWRLVRSLAAPGPLAKALMDRFRDADSKQSEDVEMKDVAADESEIVVEPASDYHDIEDHQELRSFFQKENAERAEQLSEEETKRGMFKLETDYASYFYLSNKKRRKGALARAKTAGDFVLASAPKRPDFVTTLIAAAPGVDVQMKLQEVAQTEEARAKIGPVPTRMDRGVKSVKQVPLKDGAKELMDRHFDLSIGAQLEARFKAGPNDRYLDFQWDPTAHPFGLEGTQSPTSAMGDALMGLSSLDEIARAVVNRAVKRFIKASGSDSALVVAGDVMRRLHNDLSGLHPEIICAFEQWELLEYHQRAGEVEFKSTSMLRSIRHKIGSQVEVDCPMRAAHDGGTLIISVPMSDSTTEHKAPKPEAAPPETSAIFHVDVRVLEVHRRVSELLESWALRQLLDGIKRLANASQFGTGDAVRFPNFIGTLQDVASKKIKRLLARASERGDYSIKMCSDADIERLAKYSLLSKFMDEAAAHAVWRFVTVECKEPTSAGDRALAKLMYMPDGARVKGDICHPIEARRIASHRIANRLVRWNSENLEWFKGAAKTLASDLFFSDDELESLQSDVLLLLRHYAFLLVAERIRVAGDHSFRSGFMAGCNTLMGLQKWEMHEFCNIALGICLQANHGMLVNVALIDSDGLAIMNGPRGGGAGTRICSGYSFDLERQTHTDMLRVYSTLSPPAIGPPFQLGHNLSISPVLYRHAAKSFSVTLLRFIKAQWNAKDLASMSPGARAVLPEFERLWPEISNAICEIGACCGMQSRPPSLRVFTALLVRAYEDIIHIIGERVRMPRIALTLAEEKSAFAASGAAATFDEKSTATQDDWLAFLYSNLVRFLPNGRPFTELAGVDLPALDREFSTRNNVLTAAARSVRHHWKLLKDKNDKPLSVMSAYSRELDLRPFSQPSKSYDGRVACCPYYPFILSRFAVWTLGAHRGFFTETFTPLFVAELQNLLRAKAIAPFNPLLFSTDPRGFLCSLFRAVDSLSNSPVLQYPKQANQSNGFGFCMNWILRSAMPNSNTLIPSCILRCSMTRCLLLHFLRSLFSSELTTPIRDPGLLVKPKPPCSACDGVCVCGEDGVKWDS